MFDPNSKALVIQTMLGCNAPRSCPRSPRGFYGKPAKTPIELGNFLTIIKWDRTLAARYER